jgi:predicted phosphodiesterase
MAGSIIEMAKSWIMSDLHYEILSPDVIENLSRPEADVLVIAGDYPRWHGHVLKGENERFKSDFVVEI